MPPERRAAATDSASVTSTPSSNADGSRVAVANPNANEVLFGRVGVEVDGWRCGGAVGKTTARIT
eukprot:scaffold70916_cov54-Phaeocystis_antarctica.AAC.1